MTDAKTKVARKAPDNSEASETSKPRTAPVLQVAAPSAPKSPRKRAPAVAKVAPSEEEKIASAAPEAKKSAAKRAPQATKRAVVQEAPPVAKPAKAKKDKLVRDSFTMPESEYAAIATLKKRCLNLGVAAKKSEILRAAISGLAKLSDVDVAAAIQSIEAIKTGRPAKADK